MTQIIENGHVNVKDLATRMDVSEATVRRDLRSLADLGKLELVYGGATLSRSADHSYLSKARRNIPEKQVIGRLAASLVNDGESILLDSGTTTSAMAPFLRRHRGVTVIVNSVRLVDELAGAPEMNVVVIGGKFRADTMDMVGPLATSALENLRGFRAFIGADGLSPDFGVTACDIDSAHFYRLAIRNARETILLADHQKFTAPSLYRICEFKEISRVVTDKAPSAEWIGFLNDQGVEVLHPTDNNQLD